MPTARSICLLALALAVPPGLLADVVSLHSGGKIRGRVDKSKDKATVTVTLTHGAKIKLLRSQVKHIQLQTPPQVLYKSIAPATTDTIKAQWELAQWCKKWGLKAHREFHLQRILKLDPNNPKARHGLGFTQVKGQWILHDKFQKEQGYAMYRGRWRLAQEIDILERKAKRDLAEREWLSKLMRNRRQANKKMKQSVGQLATIKDPLAVGPLVVMINKEKSRYFKGLYIDALLNIGNGAAINAVLRLMIFDPDVEVYHYCLDRIKKLDHPNTPVFLALSLKNPAMYRLNRAAHAIQTLDYKSTIPLLIDQLVRTYYVAKTGSERITTTFGSRQTFDGQTVPLLGLQPNETAQMYTYQVTNERVLSALTSLAGVNLGYDVEAWKRWHRIEQRQKGRAELERRAATSQRRE